MIKAGNRVKAEANERDIYKQWSKCQHQNKVGTSRFYLILIFTLLETAIPVYEEFLRKSDSSEKPFTHLI